MADAGFVSYKNSRTVLSESVCKFLNGMIIGAAWGCVDPFPVPGRSTPSMAAATTFRPLPIGANLASIPYSAVYFGAILGWQQLNSKSLELLRRKEDQFNDIFGLCMIYPYFRLFLGHSERRLVLHNRAVGGGVLLAAVYGTFLS